MENSIIETLKILKNGIPDILPSMPEKNLQVPHAPARNPKLNDLEKRLVINLASNKIYSLGY